MSGSAPAESGTSGVLRRIHLRLGTEARATGLPLPWLFLAALAVHGAVLLASPNPWHPDEHFQILEFAWARAGLAPLDGLPWEFEARIRPTLQPTLALAVLTALRALGLTDPETWILALRLGSLLLALGAASAVALRVGPSLGREARRVLWVTTLFLWFAPLFTGRFTSENLSGIALALALVVATGPRGKERTRRSVVVGALLGLGFVFRYQLAFAALPLLLWMAWGPGRPERRRGWAAPARALAAAAAVVAACVLVDTWFYGTWTVAPWRYFEANVVDGVAATFGTSPWWWYGAVVPLYLAPPLGIALAVLSVAGAFARPRAPWGWCFGAFLVGHVVVAHKEMRFLLPLLYLVPPLVAMAWDVVAARSRGKRWRHAVAAVLLLQNAALALVLLTPSIHRGQHFDVHYFRFLEARADGEEEAIYVLSSDGRPWASDDYDPRVYHEGRVEGVVHRPGTPLPAELEEPAAGGRVFLLTRRPEPPEVPGARLYGPLYRAEPGYRVLARWLGFGTHPVVDRLEELDGWSRSTSVRRIWEVRPDRAAAPASAS